MYLLAISLGVKLDDGDIQPYSACEATHDLDSGTPSLARQRTMHGLPGDTTDAVGDVLEGEVLTNPPVLDHLDDGVDVALCLTSEMLATSKCFWHRPQKYREVPLPVALIRITRSRFLHFGHSGAFSMRKVTVQLPSSPGLRRSPPATHHPPAC